MGGPHLFLAAFLIGILFHSVFRYERVSSILLLSIFLFLVFLVWRFPGKRRAGLVFVCLLFGFWRFDITIPSVSLQAALLEQEVSIQGVVGKKLSFWNVVDGRFAISGLQNVPLFSIVRDRATDRVGG
jgi:hypothetical protein